MAKLKLSNKKSSGSKSPMSKLLAVLLVIIVVLVIIKMVAAAFFYIALGIAAITFAITAWKFWTEQQASTTVDAVKQAVTDKVPGTVTVSFGNGGATATTSS